MKTFRYFAVIGLSAFILGSFVSPARAYTAADYYNAGLQLYNAKNYAQAIQYFSAAIQVDPNNVGALQGRANCYYVQGQYQQALDDYQKVQALQPNPQLASMIQALQAKVGTGTANTQPPAAGPAAGPASSLGSDQSSAAQTSDSFSQGVALYQQQQYAQAVPLFQKAVQDNPKDSKAYYYLGACQAQTGDMKDAAVALGISNKLNPNPSIQNYVTQLKSRLSDDDQDWVDNQIAKANTGSSPSGPAKTFGIRFEPSLVFINLADFNAEAQAGAAYAQYLQTTDPNASYSASVPTGFPNIAMEPVFRLSSNFELGIPIELGLVGNFTESGYTSGSGVTVTETFAMSAFSFGVDARYLMSLGRDMDFFIAGGPLVVPVSMDITYSDSTTSGNASAMGFGGQVQLGLDYYLGDSFAIGPFAGYQLASVSGFTGSSTYGTGEIYIYTHPSPNQYPIITAGPANSPPAGTRPLTVDLSGPFAGLMISAFF